MANFFRDLLYYQNVPHGSVNVQGNGHLGHFSVLKNVLFWTNQGSSNDEQGRIRIAWQCFEHFKLAIDSNIK